jgi:hypothetical protein
MFPAVAASLIARPPILVDAPLVVQIHVGRLQPPAEGPAVDRGYAANGPCQRQEAVACARAITWAAVRMRRL